MIVQLTVVSIICAIQTNYHNVYFFSCCQNKDEVGEGEGGWGGMGKGVGVGVGEG